MYEFAPPGRGYAYGETMPTFIPRGRSISSRSGHATARPPERLPHHRAPLLLRRAVEVLADRPATAVRHRGPLHDRPLQVGRGPPREIGPARPHEVAVMGIAGAGHGDVEQVRVEPFGATHAHASRPRGVPQLDPVDHPLSSRTLELPQGPLADRES